MPPKLRRKPSELEDATKSNLGNFVDEVRGMFSHQSAYAADPDAVQKQIDEEKRKRRKASGMGL